MSFTAHDFWLTVPVQRPARDAVADLEAEPGPAVDVIAVRVGADVGVEHLGPISMAIEEARRLLRVIPF